MSKFCYVACVKVCSFTWHFKLKICKGWGSQKIILRVLLVCCFLGFFNIGNWSLISERLKWWSITRKCLEGLQSYKTAAWRRLFKTLLSSKLSWLHSAPKVAGLGSQLGIRMNGIFYMDHTGIMARSDGKISKQLFHVFSWKHIYILVSSLLGYVGDLDCSVYWCLTTAVKDLAGTCIISY